MAPWPSRGGACAGSPPTPPPPPLGPAGALSPAARARGCAGDRASQIRCRRRRARSIAVGRRRHCRGRSGALDAPTPPALPSAPSLHLHERRPRPPLSLWQVTRRARDECRSRCAPPRPACFLPRRRAAITPSPRTRARGCSLPTPADSALKRAPHLLGGRARPRRLLAPTDDVSRARWQVQASDLRGDRRGDVRGAQRKLFGRPSAQWPVRPPHPTRRATGCRPPPVRDARHAFAPRAAPTSRAPSRPWRCAPRTRPPPRRPLLPQRPSPPRPLAPRPLSRCPPRPARRSLTDRCARARRASRRPAQAAPRAGAPLVTRVRCVVAPVG